MNSLIGGWVISDIDRQATPHCVYRVLGHQRFALHGHFKPFSILTCFAHPQHSKSFNSRLLPWYTGCLVSLSVIQLMATSIVTEKRLMRFFFAPSLCFHWAVREVLEHRQSFMSASYHHYHGLTTTFFPNRLSYSTSTLFRPPHSASLLSLVGTRKTSDADIRPSPGPPTLPARASPPDGSSSVSKTTWSSRRVP
jgi:hypothetical protein